MPGSEKMPNAAAPAPAPAKTAETSQINQPAAESGNAAERSLAETGEKQEPQKELTPEESLAATREQISQTEERLSKIESANEKSEARFDEVQKKLGVEGGERSEAAREVPGRERLGKIHASLMVYKRQLERQRETAAQILEKKIGELFLEFGALDPKKLKSIMDTGKMTNEELFKSHIFGMLQPKVAKQMAQAYKKILKGEEMQQLIVWLETADVVFYQQASKEAAEKMKNEPASEKQAENRAEPSAPAEAANNSAAAKTSTAGPAANPAAASKA